MDSVLLHLLHSAHVETTQALRDFPSFEQLVSAVECRYLGLHIVALSPFRDILRMVHNLACPTTRMAPLLKVCKVARATVLHDVNCVWHRIENATDTGSTCRDIFVSWNGSEVDIADLLLSFGSHASSVFPVFVLPPVLKREYPEMFELSPRARSFLSSRVALDRHALCSLIGSVLCTSSEARRCRSLAVAISTLANTSTLSCAYPLDLTTCTFQFLVHTARVFSKKVLLLCLTCNRRSGVRKEIGLLFGILCRTIVKSWQGASYSMRGLILDDTHNKHTVRPPRNSMVSLRLDTEEETRQRGLTTASGCSFRPQVHLSVLPPSIYGCAKRVTCLLTLACTCFLPGQIQLPGRADSSAWFTSRRDKNREWKAMHGNPPKQFFTVRSLGAQMGPMRPKTFPLTNPTTPQGAVAVRSPKQPAKSSTAASAEPQHAAAACCSTPNACLSPRAGHTLPTRGCKSPVPAQAQPSPRLADSAMVRSLFAGSGANQAQLTPQDSQSTSRISASSLLPPLTISDQPSYTQHPGRIKACQRMRVVKLCPCGELSYRYVNRFTRHIFCSNTACRTRGILKDQSIYHCRTLKCPYCMCSACFDRLPALQGSARGRALHSFDPVASDGHLQSSDFLDPENFAPSSHLPNLVGMPSDL